MMKVIGNFKVMPYARKSSVTVGEHVYVCVDNGYSHVVHVVVSEEVPDTVPVWQYVIKMPWQAPYVSPKHYPEGGCEAVYPGAEWVLRLDQTEKQVPA